MPETATARSQEVIDNFLKEEQKTAEAAAKRKKLRVIAGGDEDTTIHGGEQIAHIAINAIKEEGRPGLGLDKINALIKQADLTQENFADIEAQHLPNSTSFMEWKTYLGTILNTLIAATELSGAKLTHAQLEKVIPFLDNAKQQTERIGAEDKATKAMINKIDRLLGAFNKQMADMEAEPTMELTDEDLGLVAPAPSPEEKEKARVRSIMKDTAETLRRNMAKEAQEAAEETTKRLRQATARKTITYTKPDQEIIGTLIIKLQDELKQIDAQLSKYSKGQLAQYSKMLIQDNPQFTGVLKKIDNLMNVKTDLEQKLADLIPATGGSVRIRKEESPQTSVRGIPFPTARYYVETRKKFPQPIKEKIITRAEIEDLAENMLTDMENNADISEQLNNLSTEHLQRTAAYLQETLTQGGGAELEQKLHDDIRDILRQRRTTTIGTDHTIRELSGEEAADIASDENLTGKWFQEGERMTEKALRETPPAPPTQPEKRKGFLGKLFDQLRGKK